MQNDTYLTKALDTTTWPDFERLVEKHNGVWGGCWCMSFHSEGANKSTTYELNHQRKAQRVSEGRTHAALVYVGGIAVGWCQFGPTEELPHIKHAREYTAKLTDLPDWRITCFFVDRDYRKQGVASAALAGALEQIAVLGGGVVESYPEDVSGRKVSSTFIHNATLSLFEQYGFKKIRPLGKNNWVVQKFVSPNP
jgi:GNAT superfamily N-acetyltransferase